jgi:hypothetical protein
VREGRTDGRTDGGTDAAIHSHIQPYTATYNHIPISSTSCITCRDCSPVGLVPAQTLLLMMLKSTVMRGMDGLLAAWDGMEGPAERASNT